MAPYLEIFLTMPRRAFTLIELLVVIAIIGLLSTIAVVSLSNVRSKARDTKWLADKTQIIKALQLYYDEKNGWPSSSNNWKCFGALTAETCWRGGYSGLDTLVDAMSPYMTNFPTTGAASGSYANNRYLYLSNGTVGTQTGAFLAWPKENTMAQSECSSASLPQHYNKYWYCYEYLGP